MASDEPVDHDLHCFATMINSNKPFLANSHFCPVLITIANCLGPDQDPDQADTLSDLFWVQIVWHSDGLPGRFFSLSMNLNIPGYVQR